MHARKTSSHAPSLIGRSHAAPPEKRAQMGSAKNVPRINQIPAITHVARLMRLAQMENALNAPQIRRHAEEHAVPKVKSVIRRPVQMSVLIVVSRNSANVARPVVRKSIRVRL